MKISKLKASSVRGIPRGWPDLLVGGKGLVVYGPNGVGKSSIVDAFEFALTGRSTLFAENRQGVSWDSAAPHVKSGAAEIIITLVDGLTATDIGVAVDRSTLPATVAAWIEQAEKSNFVLRRHMLLRFVNERPQDRYALLAPFCGLGPFASIEASLQNSEERLETERIAKATRITASEQRLRQAFSLGAMSPLGELVILEKINAIISSIGVAAIGTFGELQQRKTELAATLGGKDRTDRLAALMALKTQAQRLGRVADQAQAITALGAALQALEHAHAERAQQVLVDLLAAGKQAIEAAGLDTCPLCEQPINRPALLARIDERIRADEQITRLRDVANERRKILVRPLAELITALRAIDESWVANLSKSLPAEYANEAGLCQDLIRAVDDKILTSTQLSNLADRARTSIASHDEIIKELGSLIEQEGGGDRRNKCLEVMGMIDLCLAEWAPLQELKKEQAATESRKRIIARLHGHAIESRKTAVQQTLNRVGDTANRYYAALHPNEDIGASKLAVRDVGHGSVNLTTEFYGAQEHPLLHYSESHLDTLGLCYFLAMRRHESARNSEFKVLILDDVMHSVDADHRGRVAQLLRDEFADHQIVVTTHDFHFYEALRKSLGNANFAYQAIGAWDIARGPILGDPSTDLDVILDTSNFAKRRSDDLAASGGRFFEWLLKQLDERLQVAIAARFERRHDVGSMWPPLCAKLKKQKGFVAAYPSLADDLDKSLWVRNACGAHDNETESAVTPSEVHSFAGLLANLYNAMHCDECDSMTAHQPDDGWRCDCGRLSFASKV